MKTIMVCDRWPVTVKDDYMCEALDCAEPATKGFCDECCDVLVCQAHYDEEHSNESTN